MSRGYRHIQEYEKEILQMREEGKTKQEIAEALGFSFEQIHNFFSRYHANQRKISAGAAIKRKGRPPKEYQINGEEKVAQLRYILDRKEARIKALEMENELMRDFLSLTEGK